MSDGDGSVPGDCEIDEVATDSAMEAVAPTSDPQTHNRRWRPVPVTLLVSVIVATAFAAYERFGTTANADSVEYTRNLAGGFLAIGITEDQPGFITLSALDQEKVEVDAVQTISHLAGTHTVVAVQTPRRTIRTRLRGPQVILVTEQGDVETHTVDWTVKEFNTLREAADCSHESAVKKHRCGAPFADLQEVLARWPPERVPDRVRAFLEPFRSRTHKHNHG